MNKKEKAESRALFCNARTVEDLVSDAALEKAWGSADFGSMSKRAVLRVGVLKCATGYHQGSTSMEINLDLGLITKKYALTEKGKIYLWLSNKGDQYV